MLYHIFWDHIVNIMAELVSTDQLPVKLGQEYRVKLGKSFTFPDENAFHTIKCESVAIWSTIHVPITYC